MANFATINDVISLWRPLTEDEQTKVNVLLPIVSDCLRYEAKKIGKDLDQMIAEDDILETVCKSVTVDVVKRYINNNVDGLAMSQMSESAGGYSVSGTFLNAGGGLFIKKSELSRLGLKKQRYGVIDFYG